MKALWIVLALALSGAAVANGGDNDDDSDDTGPEGCSHPHFVTYDCLDTYDFGGEDGSNGSDGIDGVDGEGGADGAAGSRGPVGPTGEAGPVGPVGPPGGLSTEWYNDIRGHFAATAAAQVHLPQIKRSRLTIGTARVMGRTGIGVGYAYRASDEGRTSFTLALGRSNSAKVVQLGVSVEF